MKKTVVFIILILVASASYSQITPRRPVIIDEGNAPQPTINNSGQPAVNNGNQPANTDTIGFEHRDDAKDSISISFKILDSTRKGFIDSSINDFDTYYSVPSHYLYLGNNGAAATSLIFQPFNKAGFDAGFHAYDIYKYTIEGTRFYKTSRPFTTLNYQLASGKEQMLKAGHTQNPKPNLNWGFDYKLINSPGFFITQNTNHNAYRVFSSYQGKRKRYHLWLSLVGNNIRGSENGGIENADYLSDPNRKDRFSVPVNLGNNAAYRNNPFVTTVLTGNSYKDFNFFLRQSYDLGKRDSIAINDSTTEYLFYPKLRIQHTFTGSKATYRFSDILADSSRYADWYGIQLGKSLDTFAVQEKWTSIKNDISLIQFPDTKNNAQFFLAGVTLQNINGTFTNSESSFYNLYVHGEYRNRTRNKLWDMLLKGELYAKGLNEGDYNVYASLSRALNKKTGSINLFFNNVSRTPSFIFDERSSFNPGNTIDFSKENITSFGAELFTRFIHLSFKNHLYINYSYFKNPTTTAQFENPINVIQATASKKFKLSKKWNWYAEATLQQTDNSSPIRVPLLYTRNRIAFEGLFFKNLNLSTGLELRYFTPYKCYGYSPITGQFVPQDTFTLKNLPDIAAYVDFRIKGFSAFIRTENLNTMSFKNGFGFTNNNFAAPLYPTQGFIFRFGIRWWFVN
jgi:hypothetical protein